MKPVLLYSEDESSDVFFVRLAFEESGRGVDVKAVETGKEAVAYLSGEGKFSDRTAFPLPFAVVLDVNTPIMSGFEALERIRATPAFQTLPVYIFSSSDRPEDRAKASALGADGYIVKPIDVTRLSVLIETVAGHLPAAAPGN